MQWHAFGSGLNSPVHAITSWDIDGTGTQPPHLIVAGSFSMAGGVVANGIARWDGTQWHAIGDGFPGAAGNSLALWDPSLDGPGSPGLVFSGTIGFDPAPPRLAIWRCDVRCLADFDNSDGVDVEDLYEYFRAWFAGDDRAECDGADGLDHNDLFHFIVSWFAGC